MFVRRCDCCGNDATEIGDKNFISVTIGFKKFKGTFDFCPKCWCEIGKDLYAEFDKKEDELDEKMAEN